MNPSASRFPPWLGPVALLAVAYGVLPIVGSSYLFEAILTPFLALSLAAVGLNLLTGYAGQVSLGSAAFMAVGAFAAYNFNLRLPGLPLLTSLVLAGFVATALGVVFGLPSLRLRGFYLAVSTLAAQFFVQWALTKFSWFSNNNPSGVIDAPSLSIFGLSLDSSIGRYLFALTIVVVLTWLAQRLRQYADRTQFRRGPRQRTRCESDWCTSAADEAARLRDLILHYRRCGRSLGLCLFAHGRAGGIHLDRSFQVVFIIIIGGLASIRGAFFGPHCS